jgi:hypothetical protein
MDWGVCLADAATRGRKEQGGEALLDPFRFALRSDRAMDRYELHAVKVCQLNICEAIGDRHSVQESPACTLAISGRGMVACVIVFRHKKPEDERAN